MDKHQNKFGVIISIGLAYLKGQDLWVQTLEGSHDNISEALQRLRGREVEYAFQHLPDAQQAGRWGMGSCQWQPAACPAGHHRSPESMVNIVDSGVVAEGGFITNGGGITTFPWASLNGHKCRVAIVTSSFEQGGDSAIPLEERLEEMQELMNTLGKALRSQK